MGGAEVLNERCLQLTVHTVDTALGVSQPNSEAHVFTKNSKYCHLHTLM